MKGPIDLFFKMGEKVTKGDIAKQQDFIYYMVWILFSAFLIMFASNTYNLIVYKEMNYFIWALIGFAITGIQYFSLKGMYDMRKLRKKATEKKEEEKIESFEEMLNGFERRSSKNEKTQKEKK